MGHDRMIYMMPRRMLYEMRMTSYGCQSRRPKPVFAQMNRGRAETQNKWILAATLNMIANMSTSLEPSLVPTLLNQTVMHHGETTTHSHHKNHLHLVHLTIYPPTNLHLP